MKLKNIVWNGIKKIVTHDNFSAIHQQTFPAVINPSLHNELRKTNATNSTSIYPDLQRHEARFTSHPIFVTARFRSGSTLLWNIFRQVDSLHSYYEPLNERMWFDKSRRQDHTDKSHMGIKDYWSEYEHIIDVKDIFSKNWTTKHLLMDQTSFNPNLYQYINSLIKQSPKQPVLQFNRVDFRLQWLKTHFNNAKIIHLYRHPRDLWISVSKNSRTISHKLSGHDYSSYNLFYTMEWAKSLTPSFPFLTPRLGKHPYYYHYLLWRLSYLYGTTYSDISISFEDLISDTNTTLMRIFNCIKIKDVNLNDLNNLVIQLKLGKWDTYADDDWYKAIELECDALLDRYFS